MNTFPGLVHTARQAMGAVSRNKVAVPEGAAGTPPFWSRRRKKKDEIERLTSVFSPVPVQAVKEETYHAKKTTQAPRRELRGVRKTVP